jgi:hypothetical protein
MKSGPFYCNYFKQEGFMKLKGTTFSRRAWFSFLVLSISLWVSVVNTPVVLASLATTSKPSEAGPKPRVFFGAGPALEFTSVATIYLPIVRRADNMSAPANCNPTGGSGGLAPGAYDTTVAGLKAVIVVGTGYKPQNPTYLGFNIHGDGGNYAKIQKSNDDLNILANEQGWILISPLAPDGNSWWQNWDQSFNNVFDNVLEEMFRKYNVCRDVLYGTTGSGGSVFWTSYFFPDKGGKYPAHVVIACGGASGHSIEAVNQIKALGKNPTVVARSTFHYVYGSADNLYDNIQRSITRYREAGFKVQVQEIAGAGHCNVWKDQGLPDWHERAAAIWKQWTK